MPSENLAYIFNEYNATPSESQIDFRTLNASTNECRILFSVVNLYLSSSGGSGAPVGFAAYNESSLAQKWYVTPV